MTVQTLFDQTLALINEEPTQYKDILIGCVNRLLADTHDTNNLILEYHHADPLSAIPVVSALTDEIPCNADLVAAFPYGLASLLIYDDEDLNKVIFWQNQYADALQRAGRAFEEKVQDVY